MSGKGALMTCQSKRLILSLHCAFAPAHSTNALWSGYSVCGLLVVPPAFM